ncbi:MAG: extracellular solute-binding protein, partial [Clostridia bacterium]|nr:extracellular solute-binding protein [Clostridia bacterium]
MYSKRNKILSVTLILVMVILSLAGCKNPENPETKTDVSSVVTQNGTIFFEDLCLWDYNDLSDFLESEKRSGKMFFNAEEGEYIKLFEDETLSKEVLDYKTLLMNKMVVQKYDALGAIIATYNLVGEEIKTDVSSQDASSTAQGEKTTITIWGSDTDRTLKEAVDAYNKLSESYEVKVVTVPSGNTLTRLKQAKAKGEAPDIVYLESGDMHLASKSNLLVDLSNHGVWELDSDFASNLYKTMANGIAVYGIPFDAETTCLAYNLDVFNFAKIKETPKTYADVVEQAKKITETYSDKNAPIGLFDVEDKISVADTFISWLYRSGGTLYSEDMTSVQFNSAMGERALNLIADLYKEGLASTTWKN